MMPEASTGAPQGRGVWGERRLQRAVWAEVPPPLRAHALESRESLGCRQERPPVKKKRKEEQKSEKRVKDWLRAAPSGESLAVPPQASCQPLPWPQSLMQKVPCRKKTRPRGPPTSRSPWCGAQRRLFYPLVIAARAPKKKIVL